MRVGVLALQGGFAPHVAALGDLGHDAALVRGPRDLDGVDGVILPGGESTTMLRLLESSGLSEPLGALVQSGVPVLATCAGLVLSAREVPGQASFGFLDVAIARNAWGRQIHSFEAIDDAGRHPLVFIRAPRIASIGRGVEVLAAYRGEPVLVREGNVTAATFHPELTADRSIHAECFGRREQPGGGSGAGSGAV